MLTAKLEFQLTDHFNGEDLNQVLAKANAQGKTLDQFLASLVRRSIATPTPKPRKKGGAK